MAARFGVERVAVVCTVDAGLQPAALRSTLCRRIAAAVSRRSPYPVVMAASAADTSFTSDFVLQVEARRRGANLELAISNPQIGRARGARGKAPLIFLAPIEKNGGVPRLQEVTAEAVDYFLSSPARNARPNKPR